MSDVPLSEQIEEPAEEGQPIDRVVTSSDHDVEIVDDTVLPEIMLEHSQDQPDQVAVRWKRLGIWREYTWSEYYDRVESFALGLAELGFEAGDVLFTIGYNRPHQLWSWMAAQSLGGMAAPNYEDMLAEEILDQLELMEPSIVYAEDQEMVDKVLAVADRAPWVETIIYRDEKGMFRYDEARDPAIVSYDDVEARGRERRDEEGLAGFIEDRIGELDPDQTAMLSPTSGTTGTPKRVQLSHFNFVNLAKAAIEIDPLPPESDYFSFLPMAWVGEQMIMIAAAYVAGWTVNFPEEPETETQDLREIGPEIMFSSPGAYEAWVADIKAKIENTTRLKRWAYDRALAIGEEYAEYVVGEKADEEPPLGLRLRRKLAYWTVYRPILDHLGLKRLKNVYTGGGPLGEEHFRYYHAIGVPLKQIWGQTEVCGFVTMHRDDDIRAETTGEVFPNVEVGVTAAGELVVRGPVVTEGYYQQPEKTAATIRDGWLYTDDFGTITEDGHVKVFDRMDDVLELEDGTAIAPINVETTLKFDPYLKEAMVVSDDAGNLVAILTIRFDNVAEWADQRDIQYSGYSDLSQKPQVLELLRQTVQETNEKLDDVRIERFVSLFKQFDPDDEELTRTGKLRRSIITDRYADVIEGLRAGEDTIDAEVEITYQDGRTDRMRGRMRVVDVDRPVEGGDR